MALISIGYHQHRVETEVRLETLADFIREFRHMLDGKRMAEKARIDAEFKKAPLPKEVVDLVPDPDDDRTEEEKTFTNLDTLAFSFYWEFVTRVCGHSFQP